MSKAKHTKGPWSHSVIHNEHHIIGGDGFRVANIVDGNKIRSEFDKVVNARLIASAPELLEALIACAAFCSGETMNKGGLIGALEKARTAIAAAKGIAS